MPQMERKPLSMSSIVATVALLVVVLLALYVGGYFALGEHSEGPLFHNHGKTWKADVRIYQREWQKTIYEPLAKVESMMTNHNVLVYWVGEFEDDPR